MDYGHIQVGGGAWVKNADVKEGTKVKILNETIRVESRFKDNEGNAKMQDVCKIKFQGDEEAKNVNLNRATLRGLVDAYGKDSKEWVGKILTAHVENTSVAGKRVKALYLVPEGYSVEEDDEGYLQVVSKSANIDAPNDDPDPDEIPF